MQGRRGTAMGRVGPQGHDPGMERCPPLLRDCKSRRPLRGRHGRTLAGRSRGHMGRRWPVAWDCGCGCSLDRSHGCSCVARRRELVRGAAGDYGSEHTLCRKRGPVVVDHGNLLLVADCGHGTSQGYENACEPLVEAVHSDQPDEGAVMRQATAIGSDAGGVAGYDGIEMALHAGNLYPGSLPLVEGESPVQFADPEGTGPGTDGAVSATDVHMEGLVPEHVQPALYPPSWLLCVHRWRLERRGASLCAYERTPVPVQGMHQRAWSTNPSWLPRVRAAALERVA